MGVNKYNIDFHCVRLWSGREEGSNRNDLLRLIMPTYLKAEF